MQISYQFDCQKRQQQNFFENIEPIMIQSSYQNSNFLKSKKSIAQKNSQFIEQISDLNNKQNFSYQLNRSNNSYTSAIGVKEKSRLMASKSRAGLIGDFQLRRQLQQNRNQYQENRIKSSSKNFQGVSHRNMQKLKVLTQSDLNQNYDDQDNFLQDEQQDQAFNQRSYNRSQSKHHDNNGNTKNCRASQNHKNNFNQKLNNRMSNRLSQRRQISSSQEKEVVEIPSYVFVPIKRLEIKYCSTEWMQQSHSQKKTNSLVYLINLIPQDISNLRNVKLLKITNCFLSTLQGIQVFQNLQQVNIRQNQLREVEQLYRIKNKDKITTINIIGNDIQHYNLAHYSNLSKVFTNLTQLNDKNYSMLKKKQTKNHRQMRNILKKQAKIQYELRKTLKKQTRNTNRELIKFNSEFAISSSNQQQTQRTHKNNQLQDFFNKKTQQDDAYSEQNQEVCSNRKIKNQRNQKMEYQNNKVNRKTSINTEDQVYEIQNCHLNPDSYSLGQNSNRKYTNTNHSNISPPRLPLKEVSLGNLQNVAITKSVNYEQKSAKKYKQKQNQDNEWNQSIPLQTVPIGRNFLQIKTQGLENVSGMNSPMHQPTATFAMQRQKQQKCTQQNKMFLFKNNKSLNNNNNKYQNHNQQLRSNNKRQRQDIFQQSNNQNQMSLSCISKISQIPTKRISNNRKRNSNTFSNNQQQRIQRQNNKYRYDNDFENTQQRSFMTNNDFYITKNQQNTSYVSGYSMSYSQCRPNQSMDEDCLLKDKNDLIQDERIVLAAAYYFKNLLKKSIYGFMEHHHWTQTQIKRRR